MKTFLNKLQRLLWSKPVSSVRVKKSVRLTVEVLEDRQLLTTYLVTTPLDGFVFNGQNLAPLPGSLRDAITKANAHLGLDTINFNINKPGVQVIAPITLLPTITDPVIINGYSQPGAQMNMFNVNWDEAVLKIQLDGANLGDVQWGTYQGPGLKITAGGSTVEGLAITRFHKGIELDGKSSDIIQGNFIGINPSAGENYGNFIGIEVNSPNNLIGGGQPGARNVISANLLDGILIQNSKANYNSVVGNFIGTSPDNSGAKPMGNGVSIEGLARGGIVIDNAHSNFIGGFYAGQGNFINQNNTGLQLLGFGAYSNRVQGNEISHNQTDGIFINEGNQNLIGGEYDPFTASSYQPGNRISSNGEDGVRIQAGDANAIRGNTIAFNKGLGINLKGPTANLQQISPSMTLAFTSGGGTEFQGVVLGPKNSALAVDLFINNQQNSDQGEIYLGHVTVYTDGILGHASFFMHLPLSLTPGANVKATVTTANGNTSQFSQYTKTINSVLGNTANERFVNQVYLDVLRRLPANGDVPVAVAYLTSPGATRAAFVQKLQNTQEYRLLQIQDLYVHLLQRNSKDTDLANPVVAQFVSKGGPLEPIKAILLGSNEYLQLHGGTNQSYVAALYKEVLGRAPTQSELFLAGFSLAYGATRADMATSLFTNLEYRQHEVKVAYKQVLNRQATQAEVDASANLMQQGKLTNDQLLANLLGSQEYFAKL